VVVVWGVGGRLLLRLALKTLLEQKGGHTLINTWLGFTVQYQLKFFKKSSGLPAFTHARASASAFELESER